MPAHQILLVAVLFVGVHSEAEKENEKKPAVVDWEKNNFGIRTSHSHEDVLNNISIDTDAPQIPKRAKPSRHEPRRKLIKPTITRNKLKIRSRNKSESGEEPSELENTIAAHIIDKARSSGRFRSADSVSKRKSSGSSSKTRSTRRDTPTTQSTEGFRSARLRSRISPRLRATTESVIKVDTVEDILRSSFKVKPNFAEFKENFMEKLTSSPSRFRHRNFHKIEKATETTSTPPTTITTAAAGTTHQQTEPEDTTTMLKTIEEEFETSDDVKHTATEIISSNTIINDAVEFVTQPSTEKSRGRKKWLRGKHNGDRKIPEIGDPAVEEKLNRLTIGQRGDFRQNKKPNPSSRRISIARSRGTKRTDVSSENNNGEVKKVDGTEAAKLDSRSAIRSRIRRPPGLNHQFKSSIIHKSKDPVAPRPIKRMRIKSNDRKVAKVESSEQVDEVNTTVKPRHLRPSRFRIPTGRRAPASRTSVKNTHTEKTVNRLRNPTGRRDHSTTTTSTTTTTTEKITISPNAHKISYTLNDSEYVDITSESPIVEHISELSNTIEHEPSQPFAQELISIVPIPDNMFSQATHQLMKAKKTSAETFLPTLVPLIRKTPTETVSHEVPIFEAGTKKVEEEEEEADEEESSEEDRDVVLPSPVKRGRYILAATING